jgi:hypothetical protein
MLVDVSNGDFVSFPNKNYEVDIKEKAYVVNEEYKKLIKTGNFNRL